MGNEASRPSMDGSPRAAGGPAPPTPTPTPSSYGAPRRAQSFPTRSPSPSPSLAPPPSRPPTAPAGTPRSDRTIQRMDKAIRKRVRGGVTYNMKLLIRGDRGSGKTSLFRRLQGLPIPAAHAPTPQLQSATINWQLRVGTEESVKCEVWDVVDRGFVPSEEGAEAGGASAAAEQDGGDAALASAAAAAAAAAAMGGYTSAKSSGMHVVAAVDASTVDVYHEAHGVVFLLDVTRWESLEYVRQQLEDVPTHIPTLVLGNFRDCAAHQRKVFKEDIQDLLYGSSDRSLKQQQALRRPVELLYFECSLLNCYGLKALHQYFGIPFLQLKLATIRQQLRIVEGEFSHLKNDLQATIREQRYVDYLEHIKATGSDIRTGRRAANGQQQQQQQQQQNEETASPSPTSDSQSSRPAPKNEPVKATRRTSSVVSDTSDVVVSANGNGADRSADAAPARAVAPSLDAAAMVQDIGDLPERDSSNLVQAMPPLKILHIEPVTAAVTTVGEEVDKQGKEQASGRAAVPSVESANASSLQLNGSEKRAKALKTKTTKKKVESDTTQGTDKPSIDEPMGLEDFQVPGQRNSDLDHFYSEDESEQEEDEDEDVVVTVADTGLTKVASGRSHKQVFIDSDSSASEQETRKSTRKSAAAARSKRRAPVSPSRQRAPPVKSAEPTDRAVRPLSPPSPRPPQPSRSAMASPRARSPAAASPPRSPLSRTAPHDDSAPATGRQPETSARSHVEEPLEVEELAGNDGENDSSNGVTEAEGPPPVALHDAQSAPASPRVPVAPKRDSGHRSPNSSRRNSSVSVASADVVEVSAALDPCEAQEPREVDSEQSPRSIASGNDAKDSGFKPAEADEGAQRAERGRGDADSAPETRGIDAHQGPERSEWKTETAKPHAQHVERADAPRAAATGEDDGFVVDAASSSAAMDAFLADDADSSDGGGVMTPSRSLGEASTSAVGAGKVVNAPAASVWEASTASASSVPTPRRPAVLSSDDDDADGREEPCSTAPLPPATSPAGWSDEQQLQPPLTGGKSDLEAFLNASESESDRDAAVASSRRQGRASSEEEEGGDARALLRLSSYSASRKSRAQRRMEREELEQFRAAMDASQRALGDVATAATATTDESIAKSDVLAAIQRAQEEAQRMLSTVEGAPRDRKRRDKQDKPKRRRSSRPADADAADKAQGDSRRRSARGGATRRTPRPRRPLAADSDSD